MIRNPILPGFNPDPSICRVGDDYYIATSTFEWFPGVQIHHSRDLINWTLVRRPLERASQLDMRGNPDSGGIWAPCLSYADGLFWLVYTDVKRLDGSFKDTHNYIVTSPTIEGVWSDPVRVNSSGFDPSLYHAPDGRKWFVNMLWNHRQKGHPANARFDGIVAQEYDAEAGALVGEVTNIFAGSYLGMSEAPHLFEKDGWTYLTVAEGGTGYGHAVTMARSRDVLGPYEMHPDVHLMTAKDAPDSPLQRVGHGQIVEGPEGRWYHTFLCGRPLPGRFCTLGRETGIEEVVWGEDGWPRLACGGMVPRLEVPVPGVEPAKPQADEKYYRFDSAKLPSDFQWLRTPEPERLFTLTGDALRLTGRESPGSWFELAFVARRQTELAYRAETEVTAEPPTYQQAAGLVTYYNKHKFHGLFLSVEPGMGRCLNIFSCPGDWREARLSYPMEPLAMPEGPLELAVEVDGAQQQFLAKLEGGWRDVGPVLDASILSDEAGRGEHGSFTGAFVGMMAFDTSGQGWQADFAHFSYSGRL
ncbi:glycoside hydrolase family 43 protein [Algicella marina]|uniref:Family 43 glycosylhydrolase n=1 Tax=Algicella marina TaxID=2683284 RepID=A0A6P1SW06_9RHOB|nr:glycoside hydrolase family 43 protein [Algicella marina]QHQ33947.1 family 43 glycosylhydrolase [Algicella marina]